jgi:hypothetical protein
MMTMEKTMKSYAERVLKLEAELEMMKKRVPIHDDKIKTSYYNVSVDVGNGQQQNEQHLNDAVELVQRMEKAEKELFVNQDAFNRNVHEEFEKIHEDRRGSSPSRSDQGMQQTNVTNNAAQCCTVSKPVNQQQ